MRKHALKVVAVVAAIGLAATALAGCSQQAGSGTEQPAATKKVLIGFAAPLTGENAVYGQGMQRAVELAVKQANASEEIKKAGYEFGVFAQDDQADPKQAVNVANLIGDNPAVVGLVGHFNSGCSIPASKVYQDKGLAMVSVSSNPKFTEQGFKVTNRIVARDDTQGRFAADLVADKLGIKKVAVIDDSTPYGEGLATEFVKQFKTKGGTVVVQDKIQAKDTDFKALVTKLKGAAPAAIYYAGGYAEGALISKQAKEAGLKVPVIGGDMLFSKDYIKIAGAGSTGDICTSLGLPLADQPGGTKFADEYKAAYNKDPEAYDSYAYDAANVIIAAVLKAGADRAKLVDAIRAISWDGVTGKTTFDSKGDTTNQAISAYKVENGDWAIIK
jgi:branched-chain amino acid transport system substrate-binding protein